MLKYKYGELEYLYDEKNPNDDIIYIQKAENQETIDTIDSFVPIKDSEHLENVVLMLYLTGELE